MKLNVLVVYMDEPYPEHSRAMRIVKVVLQKHRIPYEFAERDCLCIDDIRKRDLVISVGGDGTFLSTAHRIKDSTPLLGVNSNPKIKEGALCKADVKNFKAVIRRILQGKTGIVKLSRLDASIGKRKLTPALNEVYIGNRKPYFTSLYEIKVGKIKEFQKTSGAIIATPTGSHSWCSSAGGKKLARDFKGFELVVREPYRGKLFRPRITNMILKPNDVVEVTSRYRENIVVIDSIREEHCLEIGETVKVKLSNKPLHVVDF